MMIFWWALLIFCLSLSLRDAICAFAAVHPCFVLAQSGGEVSCWFHHLTADRMFAFASSLQYSIQQLLADSLSLSLLRPSYYSRGVLGALPL